MRILLTLSCLIVATSYADTLTFNTALLTKDTSQGNWRTRLNRDTEEWCHGNFHGIQFGTFQAAKDFDTLTDGLYNCSGEFVAIPEQPVAQIFAISNCHQVNPDVLKRSCSVDLQ